MKLYFSPGTCSLSPHIVMNEAGLQYETIKVDIKNHVTADGSDFYKINPKGYVPVLQFDDGELLTEGSAIVQYLADLKPDTKLIPPNGSFERLRAQEWLSFIATEIHKAHYPLFHSEVGSVTQDIYRKKLQDTYDYVSSKLGSNDYLLGDTFTVVDAYLFTVLKWAKFVKIDLTKWSNLVDYQERVAARPAVRNTLKAEGIK